MTECTTSDRLKQIMSERKLKQIDIINMAKPYCEKYKIQLGRNDLSQYVSGKVVPRQNKLYVLGKALNVNEAWLMGYDVPSERIETFSSSDPDMSILHIYKKLDAEDKAEIRGEMKQMLKADKYKIK